MKFGPTRKSIFNIFLIWSKRDFIGVRFLDVFPITYLPHAQSKCRISGCIITSLSLWPLAQARSASAFFLGSLSARSVHIPWGEFKARMHAWFRRNWGKGTLALTPWNPDLHGGERDYCRRGIPDSHWWPAPGTLWLLPEIVRPASSTGRPSCWPPELNRHRII